MSLKQYRCQRCGHVTEQNTNHYLQTYSSGHFNTCEKCPPWAKYPEFGGCTVWDCITPKPFEAGDIVLVDVNGQYEFARLFYIRMGKDAPAYWTVYTLSGAVMGGPPSQLELTRTNEAVPGLKDATEYLMGCDHIQLCTVPFGVEEPL